MSLSLPIRRLPIRCLYAPPTRTPIHHPQQRRHASTDEQSNPVLDAYRANNPEKETTEQPTREDLPQGMGAEGDISSSSIFEDERRLQLQQDREMNRDDRVGAYTRDPRNMARVLDPDPRHRERWERKQVIKLVQKGGRVTKDQLIKMTEREHVVKSHNMKTSIKKLGMVARQIAGKTVDEAIVQMRFSKKKVAQEVLKQLEFARDEAIVMRGMGLGAVTPPNSTEPPPTQRPMEIQLKDGKRHRVTDKSKIYIDQAWVGRGPYGKLPDYRARGRMYIMRTPWTSLSVVLKEEATRVREYNEREAKRQKQLKEKLWTALPDRPIQIQRQWYSW